MNPHSLWRNNAKRKLKEKVGGVLLLVEDVATLVELEEVWLELEEVLLLYPLLRKAKSIKKAAIFLIYNL